MIALLSAGTAWAFSSFSMGINDTIWYNPNLSPNGKTVHVHALMDARVDSWDIFFTYPSGMTATAMLETEDMRIPYVNSSNDTVILMVTLYTNAQQFTTASASISQSGYWYNPNGVFESYGTVKWEPGYYDRLFDVYFSFDVGFNGGSVTLSYYMRCSPDDRGNVSSPLSFSKQVVVQLGNRPGDINGDDVVDSSDLTALIAYTLGNNTNWDQYQFAAGDLNGDGEIDVNDVTALIALVLSDD